MNEIGVGLIGYGGIGRMHALCFQMLPLVYPQLPVRARLVAVATSSAASAARARDELGVFATTSAEELIARPDVALVDCCAPTGEHARLAELSLLAGKALFCEKPLAADPQAAARLVALAKERGLVAGVNYHLRAVPALQEAHRLIAAGLLGEVYGFQMRYHRASNLKRDRPANWRFAGPGSGVLVDLGAHLIDLTLHLLGPIASVAAQLRTLVPERPGPAGAPQAISSDDAAWLNIELAGGGRGAISVSKMVPGAGDDVRIEVYGSRGAFCFDSADPNNLLVAEGPGAPQGGRRILTASRATPAAATIGPETPSGVAQWHLASIAGFLQALGGGAEPAPSLADGLATDRVLAAAAESHAGGGIMLPVSKV